MKKYSGIIIVLVINAILLLSTIGWGLPAVWEPDSSMGPVLEMASKMSPEPKSLQKSTLHYYILGGALVPYFAVLLATGTSIAPDALKFDSPGIWTTMFIIGRLLTVLMALGTVFLAYLLGKRIADEKTGLLTATILTVTSGFFALSHFTAVDIPLTFWITFALYLLVSFAKTKHSKFLYWGAFVTGLAISTKYPAGLLVLLIPLVVFVTRMPFWKHNIRSALLVIAGFLLGTPYVLLTPLKFITEASKLFDAGGYYGIVSRIGYIQHAYNLYHIFGVFLLIAAIAGLIYCIVSRRKTETYLLFSWVVLNYLILGFWHNAPLRFIMPIVPALAVMAAIFGIDMCLKHRWVSVVITLLLLTGVWGVVGQIAYFTNDSRYESHDWVLANIPNGASIMAIGLPGYIPVLPIDASEYDALYHKIPYTGAFPSDGATKYHVDYDLLLTNYSIQGAEFTQKMDDQLGADYIIASEFQYGRFFDNISHVEGVYSGDSYPERTIFINDLLAGRKGYIKVAEFHYEFPFSSNPSYVNPAIIVLQREDG